METLTVQYGGASLAMPSLAWIKWPGHLVAYKDFPACYCGAGDGWGEKVVPDRIFGMWRWCGWSILISPACWIHDRDFELAEPTREAFEECNERFHRNIDALISAADVPDFIKRLARYRAATYRNAVDGFGWAIFQDLKMEQGHDLP